MMGCETKLLIIFITSVQFLQDDYHTKIFANLLLIDASSLFERDFSVREIPYPGTKPSQLAGTAIFLKQPRPKR